MRLPMRCTWHSLGSMSTITIAIFLPQDPLHKWADLQRALLTEGQSVWCCKDCIGIIKEDTNATYEEIRVKVEAAAAARLEPLPEITGDATSVTPAGESAKVAEAKAKANSCMLELAEACSKCLIS